ncbi:MAG: endolytic transglycosylase MltG [Actinomycetota bacterium]|nr:endolytic transglycosylase MltG [Actinomycetota bacterium]
MIVRRRLIALGVLLTALVLLFFAVAGLPGGGKKKAPPNPLALVKPLHIVFPEGFTRKDMAKRITAVNKIAKEKRGKQPLLSQPEYLRLTTNPRLVPRGFRPAHRLEGFLFPATYEFTLRTPTRRLIALQLQAFRRNWAQVNLGYTRSRKLTPYDVLTIASMVEKETLAPDERRKVARVIYNRLHDGMTLGIDATIRYGLDVPGTEPLKQSDLDSNSPYNTRNHTGLTPTPIANPGLASIQAAAHPANGCWLYFVRKPDKVHHFFACNERDFINYKNAHGYK